MIFDDQSCEGCEGKNENCFLPVAGKNSVRRCKVYNRLVVKNRLMKMITGRNDIRHFKIPTFEELEFDINMIEGKVREIRAFISTHNHLLYIQSNPGTGKTHILLSLTYELMLKKMKVYYITTARLSELLLNEERSLIDAERLIEEGFNEKRPHMRNNILSEELGKFRNSKIKIIDDFCYVNNAYFAGYLSPLLESTGNKIILASIFPKKKLPYGRGIISRLNAARVVSWDGRSYRGLLK